MASRTRARLDALAVGVMLLLCGVWGFQQVASKVTLSQGVPPFLQAVLRSAIAGPLLLAWIAARGGRPALRALVARDGSLGPGLLLGAVFGVEFMLLFPGVQLTSASRAVVLLFTGAFFTAIAAHLVLPAERLRPVHVAGLLLAFLGVVATVGQPAGGRGGSLAGDALVLAAATLWGFNTVMVKASPALGRISSEKVLAYQLFGALPLLAVGTWFAGEWQVPDATGLAWTLLLFQGAVVAFASYLTWYWLVSIYPAGRLAAFTFLSPPLGVMAAWVLLGETPTPMLLVGLVCISAGLWLVNR